MIKYQVSITKKHGLDWFYEITVREMGIYEYVEKLQIKLDELATTRELLAVKYPGCTFHEHVYSGFIY